MAWALDAAATPVAQTSGSTITLSHTLGAGAGDRLVIACGIETSNRNVTGITYDTVAMTLVANPPSGQAESELYYMLEAQLPGAGTYSVVITVTTAFSGGNNGVGHCVSFTGVAQLAAESAAGEAYGSVSVITDDVTPTTDAALIVASLGVGDNRTITPNSGQGAAVSSLDTTVGVYRTKIFAWTGPTPAALLSSQFTLSGASAFNTQHVAAFGIAGAGGGAPKFLPDSLGLNHLVGVR